MQFYVLSAIQGCKECPDTMIPHGANKASEWEESLWLVFGVVFGGLS